MPYDPNTGQYYDAGTGLGYNPYAQAYPYPNDPRYTQPQFQNAVPGANAPTGPSYPGYPYASQYGTPTSPGSDALYAPGYGPNGPLTGQPTTGSSTGAPTYDPSNPNPFINYYYRQTYGTDAPPDQLQYWSGKLASGEQMGNGQVASPAYWMMRLQNPNYDTGGGGGLGSGQSYNGPAFSMGGPFTGFQSVNPGSFGYDPLQNQQSFQLPTGQQALDQDPGYQFRLQQGLDALQNSAAARGGLGDPNTLRAVQDYGQGAASQEYQNAYNRALQTYQTNTGTNLAAQQQQYQQGLGAFQTNAQTALQANNQNFQNALAQYQANFQDPLAAYQANVNAQLGFGSLGLQSQLGLGNLGVSQGYLGLAGDQQGYNQLYGLANLGLQGTQGAVGANQGYLTGLENLYGNNANAQGNLYTQNANAGAAGTVGAANAQSGGLGNIGNMASQFAALAALRGLNRPQPQGQGPVSGGGW